MILGWAIKISPESFRKSVFPFEGFESVTMQNRRWNIENTAMMCGLIKRNRLWVPLMKCAFHPLKRVLGHLHSHVYVWDTKSNSQDGSYSPCSDAEDLTVYVEWLIQSQVNTFFLPPAFEEAHGIELMWLHSLIRSELRGLGGEAVPPSSCWWASITQRLCCSFCLC